ncbi:RasGEF domain-containing protein [Legionella norrlandica]|nr:RasGEF domain-containing protein [Legionella norrlandica]
MNKEMILELIDSERDQQTIATMLKNWLQENPSLNDLSFKAQRSIFHLLVLKNKPLVIQELLQIDYFKLLASKADKYQKTPLHYAVRHKKYKEILDLLITSLPQLELNSQDKEGNTALHNAVQENQIWAILALVNSGRVDRILPNKENKTAFDLAQNNAALTKALVYFDLPQISSGLKISEDANTLARLKNTFPMLSKSKINNPSSNELMDKSKPKLISWVSIFKLTDLKEKEELVSWDIENVTALFKRMVFAYKENSVQYHDMLKQFISACKLVDLAQNQEMINSILKELGPVNHCIIDDILNNLTIELQNKYTTVQAGQESSMEDFLCLVLQEGLYIDKTPPKKPPFDDILAEQSGLLGFLWILTAGLDPTETERKINLERIAHASVYLQSINSHVEIIIALRLLFPFFDQHQKLVANYIVCQLLISTPTKLPQDSNFIEQLNKFSLCNREEKYGLGQVGEKLDNLLNTLVQQNDAFYQQPLFTNYCSFQKIAQTFINPVAYQSFNELVDRALTLKSNKRKKEIELIAQELRILSMKFYQTVALSEFADANWTKEDPNLAINVLRLAMHFNQLSNYFTAKVLNQPSLDKTVNAIQLLIQIAQALCPLASGQFVDMHHLLIITSVLENSSISRLKPCMAALTETEQAIMAELTKIVGFSQNKYWQRAVQNSCMTLPYVGLFQSDLTFAKDGNPYPLGRAETCGSILLKILATKQLVNFHLFRVPKTDLFEFLDTYLSVNENRLYETSLRKFPKETKDIFDFDEPEKALKHPLEKLDWKDLEYNEIPRNEQSPKALGEKLIGSWLLLDELNFKYLDHYAIPRIKFKEKTYPPTQLGEILIAFFMMQLKELEEPAKDQEALEQRQAKKIFLTALSDKITTTVNTFIIIHNNYQNSKLSAKAILSLENKIEEMKNALGQNEPNIELKYQNNSKIKSFKRRSLSFFIPRIDLNDLVTHVQEPIVEHTPSRNKSYRSKHSASRASENDILIHSSQASNLETKVKQLKGKETKSKFLSLSGKPNRLFSPLAANPSVYSERSIALAESKDETTKQESPNRPDITS